MGDREGDPSLISVEDFEKRGIKIDPNWTSLEALLTVTSLASVKLEEERRLKEKGGLNLMMKKSNGVLKLDKGKNPVDIFENKTLSRSGADHKRARLLIEKALKKPLVPAECRLQSDYMKRSFDQEDHQEPYFEHVSKTKKKKKKKLKMDKEIVVNLSMPQNLKELIKNNLNGNKIVLIIQKFLYATDVSENHNRVSIPVNQVREEFLIQEEKGHLDNGGKMQVPFIEPSLNVCKIVLKKWEMPKVKSSSGCYVLIKEWKEVKDRNKLKEGDEIQLWSFRNPEEQLCLALVMVQRS